jgi:DNA-binding transcriptional LysR family regulator
VATELLEWLQEETEKITAARTKVKQIAVTASTGFTSLWLIPRLKRFRKLHPDIDVRIAATVEILNLERSRLDVAIRYCRPADAPEDAIRLFDHVTLPVCSPALAGDPSKPLARPEDLRNHVLLHDTYGALNAYADWDSWLAAVGVPDLKPAGAIFFNQYEQMIQAAIHGQGVALGDRALLHELVDSGALIAPFGSSVAASRTCFIVKSRLCSEKPHVQLFVQWLCNEAKHAPGG